MSFSPTRRDVLMGSAALLATTSSYGMAFARVGRAARQPLDLPQPVERVGRRPRKAVRDGKLGMRAARPFLLDQARRRAQPSVLRVECCERGRDLRPIGC